MRISHGAIYQSLFIQGRGGLKRELVACLRTGRALRVPRARARQRRDGMVTPDVMISQRPAEAEDRAVPGHWEGTTSTKGTDLARWNTNELEAVAATLNSRPRKTLGWQTPGEAFN
ncbi:hypothetical protein GCM10018962_24020 [Dactylosporangium matsuzakiense]|uniref:Transposase n=1 Tax=Dactylosporangium matsuzakiense TaxID=53360 RepID=A0A9W6KUJ5_9ACTN|nr:hypothetical protein GCM10017581_092440 [Dactylosporangium matsuzakiense]